MLINDSFILLHNVPRKLLLMENRGERKDGNKKFKYSCSLNSKAVFACIWEERPFVVLMKVVIGINGRPAS